MKKSLPESVEINTEQENIVQGRKFRRALSWVLLAAAVLFIVPVGCIMFVISNLWSAADKVLNKIGK